MNAGVIGECERCHEQRNLTKHRKIPGCRGGTYNPSNVIMVWRPCHDILDTEIGVRISAGRIGRYVPCEKCGDVTEKIEVGLCRNCRKQQMGVVFDKTSWLQEIYGPPEGTFSLGQIARWK